MATKMIKHGKETYASKAAMMKHEKSEPLKKQVAEDMKMAKGGMAKKPAVAIMIGMAKPKGKTAMAKGGMAKKKC